jgi:hypothetical protein
MANKTITQLPSASLATGSNVLPIVQEDNTNQITIDNLAIGIFNTSAADSFVTKTTGSWTLTTGSNDVSFTVPIGGTYSMWVNGNIPNGIVVWTTTVTISNPNVPVIGNQYSWYYATGNALVLTSIPDQIIGENGIILNSPEAYVPADSNVFRFSITNNSVTSQEVNWGYIKL